MKKSKNRVKYIFCVLWFLFVGIVGLTFGGKDSNAEEKVIRVGCTEYGQMIQKNGDDFTGYGVEYLQMITQYTGWKYEYVMISEEDRIKELESGNIDLLCDVSEDEVGKENLLLSEENCSMYYGLLCAKKEDTTVFFDDFEAMNGKRIAINVSRYMEEMLVEFSIDHQIAYTPVYCSSFAEMEAALENGKADLMVASNQRDLEGYKFVAKVGVRNQFFATSKDKADLMEQIDFASRQIKLKQPFIIATLYDEYYGRPVNVLTGTTREEYEFIHSGEPVCVVCDAGSFPVGYVDERTGEYSGIYADVLKMIGDESGLDFEFIPVENYSEAWDMLGSGEADMSAGMYLNDALAEEYGITYTNSYVYMNYTMIEKADTLLSDSPEIAVPKNYIGIQAMIKEKYPDWQIVLAEDIEESLNMVENGEAEGTLLNSVFLQTAYNLNDYETLVIMPMNEVAVPMRCGLGGEHAELLKQILNKAISHISLENFERCVTENAINVAYEPSIENIIKKYFSFVVGIIIIVGVAFVSVLFVRERHYKYLAMTDRLTGLWNGIKFRREAEMLLVHNRKKEYQLISLDMERFKYVNNDMGEKAADKILQIVGKRLHEQFGNTALYGREMADMFWILAEKRENLEEVLHKISEEIIFENNGVEHRYKPIFKFGICGIEELELPISEYIDRAIVARKAIKGNAGKSIEYYDNEMADMISNERRIEKRMETALKNREFVVYYQPKYQLKSETIIGAEALVRWIDPEEGLVSPGVFIPVFERNGFIIQLDFYVYEEVLKDMTKWREEGRKQIVVSMNVSRAHIGTVDFLKNLIELVDRYEMPHDLIELELTETILGGKRQDILGFISACKAAGFKISIDDFGSGYSSLNLLKELPVDVLKIDREFLNETEESEKSSIIVEQVVEMATKINIGTLCEGVETRGQAEFLKQIGCDMAQGFLYSRPVPRNEFEELLGA